MPRRGLAVAISGGDVTLYNTHLDHVNPWARGWSAALIRRHMDRRWDGSPQILLGDMNGNGVVDNFDISDFELALTQPEINL